MSNSSPLSTSITESSEPRYSEPSGLAVCGAGFANATRAFCRVCLAALDLLLPRGIPVTGAFQRMEGCRTAKPETKCETLRDSQVCEEADLGQERGGQKYEQARDRSNKG